MARSHDDTAVKMLLLAQATLWRMGVPKTISFYFPLDPSLTFPLVLLLTGCQETQLFSVLM